MESEPYLPAELEREIFELTAILYPSIIPTLLRVARRVLAWTEPLMYWVLFMDEEIKSRAILEAFRSKPPDFFAGSVRHVFFHRAAGCTVEETLEILKLCPNVNNFAAIYQFFNPSLLPILSTMSIKRLAGDLSDLFGGLEAIDLRHALFSNITHIDIFDLIGFHDARTDLCRDISALPSLTHLCLNLQLRWTTVQMLLSDCKRLEVFVNLWQSRSGPRARTLAAKAPIRDVRFVMTGYTDYWRHWEIDARGGDSFWTTAEIFVERKRKGLIQADCFWVKEGTYDEKHNGVAGWIEDEADDTEIDSD